MVVTPWSGAGMIVFIPPLAAETDVEFLYPHLSEQKPAQQKKWKAGNMLSLHCYHMLKVLFFSG